MGCGYGASTIIMAKAYPNSTFVGYDYHAASIEVARRRAAEADVSDRDGRSEGPWQRSAGRSALGSVAAPGLVFNCDCFKAH